MDSARDITLALLAGGLGSRMGRAKGKLKICGETILAFLHRQLSWPGPTMLVTAPGRTAPPGAELFARECVDPVGGEGPLRGILTALENAKNDIIVITIDMPSITTPMLTFLVQSAHACPAVQGLMCARVAGIENIVEPFPCYLRASAQDLVTAALLDRRRSVRGLLRDPRFAAIDAPTEWPASVWTNLNTPEDLAAFEKTLGREDNI